MRNHEVTREQRLLDEKGNIGEPGWARRPLWAYDRADIRAPKWRIKEWDYYLVVHDGRPDGTESFAAAFTISDDGYVGLQSVSFLLLEEGKLPQGSGSADVSVRSDSCECFGGNIAWEHTETVLNVLPLGRLHLPNSSAAGDVRYKDKRLQMRFEKNAGERRLRCRFADFLKGEPLFADIRLAQPEMDSMTIATPFAREGRFYYNQKINCLRASGAVRVGAKVYRFNPKLDFGTLDWGRGVWTYDNTWYWGNGNAVIDGHVVGWNIGYGFGDTSAASENLLIVDGVAHKLDDLDFGIPGDVDPKKMDGPAYMEPWQMRSSDGRFEMRFVPILDRAAKMNFKAIVSDQHQVFGRMSGKAVLDDGKVLEFKDVLCFAEKVHNRY